MRGRSVRPAGSTPRRWPCESGRQEHGRRDWHWPASHTQTITVRLWFVKRGVTQFPIAALRDINSFDWAAGGVPDWQALDWVGFRFGRAPCFRVSADRAWADL